MDNVLINKDSKEIETHEDDKEKNNGQPSKILPEKLMFFMPDTRGYEQIEKEKRQGWTVKSIGAYDGPMEKYKGHIMCILQQSNNMQISKDSSPSFSPRAKTEKKLEDA